jgi:hypothetical protein
MCFVNHQPYGNMVMPVIMSEMNTSKASHLVEAELVLAYPHEAYRDATADHSYRHSRSVKQEHRVSYVRKKNGCNTSC